MNIAIYIYEGAEVLDFAGPYEVFSTAARFLPDISKPKAFLVAESESPVKARADFRVNPHYGFTDHPPVDVLIIAGGVHMAEMQKENVLAWIRKVSESTRLTASVCTGAFLLANAGLLANRKVTTHWEDVPDLTRQFLQLDVLENRRWVEDGKFITSGGISAGIDMSLYLVSKLFDRQLAENTARQMEYDWNESPLS